MDWLAALQHLRRDGQAGVLVTVVGVQGHAPRDAGAKLVVSAERSWGSVGGGNLEQTAIDHARELIAAGATEPQLREAKLTERSHNAYGRQCCGGAVQLLYEPLPAWPVVAIFGVGHVGYELGRILSRLAVQLHLVDSRAEQLDRIRIAELIDGTAEVTVHHAVLGEQVLEQLPAGAHVLIMTHDHAEDLALCDAALRRPTLGSIGLIGSAAKWARFRTRLAGEGHPAELIERIQCPIGLAEVAGKDPAVIAIATAAELVQRTTITPQRRPGAEANRTSAVTSSESRYSARAT